MTTQITVTIPADLWFTSNDLRGTYRKWAPKTRQLRLLGKQAALAAGLPRFNVVHLTVFVGYPTGVVADPPNIAGTVAKACLDGIVDAGVLPGDDSRHIAATTYAREAKKSARGTHTLRFVFVDQEVPWGGPGNDAA